MTSFFEQYKSPQWQKRRLEMLEAAEWECMSCGEKEAQLHVHHVQYIHSRKVWEYDDADLRVLCDACHSAVHDYKDEMVRIISSLPRWEIERVCAYGLAAYAARAHELGRARKLKIGSDAALTAFADFFGVPPGELILCAGDDDWAQIADIKALAARLKEAE